MSFFLSDQILEETARVLLRPGRMRCYGYPDESVILYLKSFEHTAEIVSVVPTIAPVARDPNDDMILACAMTVRADYLVSRDKALLVLNAFEGTQIVTPEVFLQIIRSQS